MSRTPSRTTSFRAAVLVAAGLLVAGLTSPAVADKPDRTGPPSSDGGSTDSSSGMRIVSFGTGGVAVPLTPGAPDHYIVADMDFTLTVEFVNGGGKPQPLSKTDFVPIELKSSDAHPDDSDLELTGDVEPNATRFTFEGTFTEAAADTVVTITASTNPTASVVSEPFDVLIDSSSDNRIALGDDGACADTCARLLPPGGGFAGGTLLSRGFCSTNGPDCLTGKYVQALAAFPGGGVGNPDDPASLVVTCDKDVCGTGAIHRHGLNVQLVPGTEPVEAPECPAKGVVGADQDFCVDYVQSTRDGSGDTHLYLLFVVDAKVRWM